MKKIQTKMTVMKFKNSKDKGKILKATRGGKKMTTKNQESK